MSETWISSKLYINDGSGREQLVHYQTDSKNIIDFEQAVNDIINNSFTNPTFYGTVSLDNLHVLGTSQLDGDVTCNSDLAVHGTIRVSDQGVISSNNTFTRLSTRVGTYIDLKETGGWDIVSKNGENIYSTLSASSNGDLSYDGNVTLDKNLKVNGTISSPIILPYATITSDTTSTIIKTTTGASIDIPNVANREIQLKTSNNHTFALTGDGKITVDGVEVASKEIILNAVYPIGCTYITLTAVNPKHRLGIGEWERVGNGLQLAVVGASSDANGVSHTIIAGENNGEWYHTLIKKEIPEHSHKVTCTENGNHTHERGTMNITGHFTGMDVDNKCYGAFKLKNPGFDAWNATGDSGDHRAIYFDASETWSGETSEKGIHDHEITIGNTGGGEHHNLINPSFGIYLWKRVS